MAARKRELIEPHPLSPCPALTIVFDLLRRSAESERPTSTTSLNSPFLLRRT